MIFGVGTDIVQISRIQAATARQAERFVKKILGPQEFAVYQERLAKVPAHGLRYLATRFAAKEALSKALGLGMLLPMSWHAAQVLNQLDGRPYLLIEGELKQWMDQRQLHAQISISDEVEYALAFVILEQSGHAE